MFLFCSNLYYKKAYMARCGKVSNRLYFESKKESKLNQNMNIKTRSSSDVDNYYYIYENRAKEFKLQNKMKKLTCHCGGVEAEVKLPEKGFEKLVRCNCSICKRKGYIMTPVSPENFKLIKGQDLLTLYQYHTKVAEHYFCSKCGIYTHTNPRSNHDKVYMINVGCM